MTTDTSEKENSQKGKPQMKSGEESGSTGKGTADQTQAQGPSVTIKDTRFGDITVPEDSVITIKDGLIGFSPQQQFVMLDYKAPFCWLQSVDEPNLAFVVVDGFEFGQDYAPKAPRGNATIDLKEEDEYAILVIVTVRPDPSQTTANLKAPIFVNLRNRQGVQIIFDNPQFSTRFQIWQDKQEE